MASRRPLVCCYDLTSRPPAHPHKVRLTLLPTTHTQFEPKTLLALRLQVISCISRIGAGKCTGGVHQYSAPSVARCVVATWRMSDFGNCFWTVSQLHDSERDPFSAASLSGCVLGRPKCLDQTQAYERQACQIAMKTHTMSVSEPERVSESITLSQRVSNSVRANYQVSERIIRCQSEPTSVRSPGDTPMGSPFAPSVTTKGCPRSNSRWSWS